MNRIKEARKASGLSQKYVAMTLGVAGPSVSNWESGKTKPTPENFMSLAQLFGVTVDYLMGYSDEPPVKTAGTALPTSAKAEANMAEFDAIISGLTDEQKEKVKEYILFLISQRK